MTNDTQYKRLLDMNIKQLSPGEYRASDRQHVECLICNHHYTTQYNIVQQGYKKQQTNGCTNCLKNNKLQRARDIVNKMADTVRNMGFIINDDPITIYASDHDNINVYHNKQKLSVTRTECGHTLKVNLHQVYQGKAICGECNKKAKAQRLRATHDEEIRIFEATKKRLGSI